MYNSLKILYKTGELLSSLDAARIKTDKFLSEILDQQNLELYYKYHEPIRENFSIIIEEFNFINLHLQFRYRKVINWVLNDIDRRIKEIEKLYNQYYA